MIDEDPRKQYVRRLQQFMKETAAKKVNDDFIFLPQRERNLRIEFQNEVLKKIERDHSTLKRPDSLRRTIGCSFFLVLLVGTFAIPAYFMSSLDEGTTFLVSFVALIAVCYFGAKWMTTGTNFFESSKLTNFGEELIKYSKEIFQDMWDEAKAEHYSNLSKLRDSNRNNIEKYLND